MSLISSCDLLSTIWILSYVEAIIATGHGNICDKIKIKATNWVNLRHKSIYICTIFKIISKRTEIDYLLILFQLLYASTFYKSNK